MCLESKNNIEIVFLYLEKGNFHFSVMTRLDHLPGLRVNLS